MSILNKRIKDLTKEDLEKHTRYIGTPEFPFPMKTIQTIRNKDGEKVQGEVLGVLDDLKNGLQILSDLPQEKIDGMAFREMPAPGHLIYAQDMIMNAHPTKGSRRIQYFKGTRGGGKTYAVEWLGRLMSEAGTDVVNCGNADLSNLVFETVIDSGGNSIFDILDRKVKNKTINPVTLMHLKKLVGAEAITKDGIDWEKASAYAEQKGSDTLADEILKLAHTEEFGSGGNALGLSQRVGRFVENLEKGRITLLDEYPRHKEGSDAGFHRLFEFVAGLIPNYVEISSLAEKNDPAGSMIELKDEDRRVGSIVMLSGNTVDDGSDVHELPESVYSRVDVKNFTDLDVEDWQHRWGQFLTGAPLSTHYYAQHDRWKDDPEGFVEYYKAGLTRGLSEEEIKKIPKEYFERVDNFEDTLKATRILAEFMHGWADMMSKAAMGTGFGELMMEVDEIFKAELSLDPRKIKRLADISKQIAPNVRLPQSAEGKIVHDTLTKTESGRLLKAMLDLVYMTTKKVGKDQTYDRIQSLIETTDLMRVADLLEQNPYVSSNPRVQTRALRDYVCETYFDKTGADRPDTYDDLMSTAMSDMCFAQMSDTEHDDILQEEHFDAEDDVDVEETTMSPEAYAPSVTLLNDEDPELMMAEPFRRAFVVDKAALLESSTVKLDIEELGKSVTYESLMRAMVLPKMQKHNLQALWDTALTESGTFSNDNEDPAALAMAQSLDSAPIAVTTLELRNEFNKRSTLHVFRNNQTNNLLFVGDSLPQDLRDKMDAARIQYVDKSAKNAADKINCAIQKMVGSEDEEKMKTLKSAFMLRNRVKSTSASEVEKNSLGELICNDNLETFLPRWVLAEKDYDDALEM